METYDEEVYVKQHLGLGDHLMCAGMIRVFAQQYKKVHLFCKQAYYDSVSFLFHDEPKINIIVADDHQAEAIMSQGKYRSIRIGMKDFHGRNIEDSFYLHGGVSLEHKWNSFEIVRDIDRELQVVEKSGIDITKPYIFLHEDESRQQTINRNLLPPFPIFKPNAELTPNIFDNLTLMEKAAEIHLIESCMLMIVEHCYPENKQKIVAHRYARKMRQWESAMLRKNWTIIGDTID
jgi:hypothetical protein